MRAVRYKGDTRKRRSTEREIGNGFTLIHCDVGNNNILVPRDGDRPIYIIDRQPFDWSLTTWLGVYNLAHAIVLDWEVETRRRLEVPIIRHDYNQLIKNGVYGYSWEQIKRVWISRFPILTT